MLPGLRVGVEPAVLKTKVSHTEVALLLILLLFAVTALGGELLLGLRDLRRLQRMSETGSSAIAIGPLSGYQPNGRPASLTPGEGDHVLVFVLRPEKRTEEARLYMGAAGWLRSRSVFPLAVCSGGACASQGTDGDSKKGLPVVAYATYEGMKAVADADANGMILLVRTKDWHVEKRLRRPTSLAELEESLGKALSR